MNTFNRIVSGVIFALVFILVAPQAAMATEAMPNWSPADLEHVEVPVETSEGITLSAYVTRPVGSHGKTPAIFFTQWVVCSSIAPREDRLSVEEYVALASGFALIRVDRAGTGRSEGPACSELDYETEVRHYREAFDALIAHPWIDRDRIAVMGRSLGSTTAPLVALGKPVIGVIAQGAGALTYFERMVFFDRIQLERQPNLKPNEIDREMRRRIRFHHHYLVEQKTPTQIEQEHPDLSGVWESLRGTANAPHYGRPYTWHWQAARSNWLSTWLAIEAPVMVVFGEFEQFESRHGHRTIIDTINRVRPGNATWLELPSTGHSLSRYDTVLDAYEREDGNPRPIDFAQPVADWLKQRLSDPHAKVGP
ncbi:MAG: alpha/beta fold hydrolase [Pseudomonadota bacterium]